MHSTGSFLLTTIERLRMLLDESSTKYGDAFLAQNIIMPSMVNVWSRLSLTMDNPVLVRYTFTIEDGVYQYQLPPNIGEVWMLVRYNDNEEVIQDWKPRGEMHPRGPGWRIEANTISFNPIPTLTAAQLGDTWDLVYVPSGDFLPHYATDGSLGDPRPGTSSSEETAIAEPTTFYLSSSPTVGLVDQRPNSYAGAILRILKKSDNSVTIVEERLIDSHDAEAGSVTVRIPFDYYEYADVVSYEIAPVGAQALQSAVAADGALTLATMKNVSSKQMQFLQIEYRKAFKTIVDNWQNLNQRRPKGWDRKTRDNPERNIWFLS